MENVTNPAIDIVQYNGEGQPLLTKADLARQIMQQQGVPMTGANQQRAMQLAQGHAVDADGDTREPDNDGDDPFNIGASGDPGLAANVPNIVPTIAGTKMQGRAAPTNVMPIQGAAFIDPSVAAVDTNTVGTGIPPTVNGMAVGSVDPNAAAENSGWADLMMNAAVLGVPVATLIGGNRIATAGNRTASVPSGVSDPVVTGSNANTLRQPTAGISTSDELLAKSGYKPGEMMKRGIAEQAAMADASRGTVVAPNTANTPPVRTTADYAFPGAYEPAPYDMPAYSVRGSTPTAAAEYAPNLTPATRAAKAKPKIDPATADALTAGLARTLARMAR